MCLINNFIKSLNGSIFCYMSLLLLIGAWEDFKPPLWLLEDAVLEYL